MEGSGLKVEVSVGTGIIEKNSNQKSKKNSTICKKQKRKEKRHADVNEVALVELLLSLNGM